MNRPRERTRTTSPQAWTHPRASACDVSVALKRVALCASLACLVALHASCAVEEKRSGIPAGAQSTIDSLTEDIAAGRDEKVYRDAAEEWRREVTLEEHQKMLERIRTRLGKIESRRFHRGVEQQHASGRLSGHTLDVTYETTFERGSGMEAFTLVERDARWQLASYAISSDLLQ